MASGYERSGFAGSGWRLLLGFVFASCCQFGEARSNSEPRRTVLLLAPATLLDQSDRQSGPFGEDGNSMLPAGSAPLLRGRPAIARDYRDRRGPSVRGGVGLDLDLPDAGKLHLDLLPARDITRPGMRWRVDGDDRLVLGKLWSLGGCLDLIRSRSTNTDAGERHVQLAPQLIIDVDGVLQLRGGARLMLQRGHWSDLSERDAGVGAVWQARLAWRF